MKLVSWACHKWPEFLKNLLASHRKLCQNLKVGSANDFVHRESIAASSHILLVKTASEFALLLCRFFDEVKCFQLICVGICLCPSNHSNFNQLEAIHCSTSYVQFCSTTSFKFEVSFVSEGD